MYEQMLAQPKSVNFLPSRMYSRRQFHQRSTFSFYARRSQKHKKTVKLSIFLHFWDLQA